MKNYFLEEREKNKMKKIIVSFLCAVMTLSLTACGAENNEAIGSNNSIVTEDKEDSINSNSDVQSSADENSTAENDEESEFPLQVIVYDDNKADILYSFDGDSAPVSCHINMGKYGVALVDYGNGYQCNICLIDGADSTLVADCLYSIDGNTIVFNVDMTAFEDFAFTNVTDYETFADFGAGGGKIIYTAKDVTKQGEQVATEDSSPEIQESLENSETAEDEKSFIGVKYFNDGPVWGASEFVLKGADENGLPTEIVISNSGSAYGEELDGSFSIKISEYSEYNKVENYIDPSSVTLRMTVFKNLNYSVFMKYG